MDKRRTYESISTKFCNAKLKGECTTCNRQPTQQKTRQATPYWETNNMNTRSFQRKLQFNVRCTLNQKQMQKEYKHIKHEVLHNKTFEFKTQFHTQNRSSI